MNRKKKGKRRQTREKNRRLKKKKKKYIYGSFRYTKKNRNWHLPNFSRDSKTYKKKLNIHDECPKKKKKEKLSFD